MASSLLWLAAASSAQLVTVTRSTAEPTPPTQVTAAAAFTTTSSSSTATATTIQLAQPTMYNLNSSEPDCGQPPVSYFEVDLQGDASLEQAAVFRGIPAAAQRCQLKWRQADAAERGRFEVGRHGRTKARQLTGFPAAGEPVTYDGLRAFDADDGVATFSPDFTQWPEHAGPFDHPAGTIPCSPDIYLRIAVNRAEGDGFVHLDQDAEDGFYISYVL
ncbi:hypothetical protein SLS62_009440 [Diatrype stigma]|uniref:Ubiquitin 3 binding protein But2 C-terminal domain-containing protein n=1 Tax=Diatrype stigma TaxID=117547 RepID=A0AAN9YKH8_9PEZI